MKLTVANKETVGTWGGDFVRYITLTRDTPNAAFDFVPHGETTLEIAGYNSAITTIGDQRFSLNAISTYRKLKSIGFV